jgi:hypothetical protein
MPVLEPTASSNCVVKPRTFTCAEYKYRVVVFWSVVFVSLAVRVAAAHVHFPASTGRDHRQRQHRSRDGDEWGAVPQMGVNGASRADEMKTTWVTLNEPAGL